MTCYSKATQTTDRAGDNLHSNDDDQLSNTHLQEIIHNNIIFVVFFIFQTTFVYKYKTK